MGHYDTQEVCLNGHQTTASYQSSPEFRRKFCPECGEETIHQCLECSHPIKGYYNVEGVISFFETSVPTHCENCGNPYPWTLRKVEAVQAVETVSYDAASLVEQVCSRFHLIARQIRTRHGDRETLAVEDEYDVQDLLHSLLHIYFDDIRKEEWTPSYAGGSSRVDFLLKDDSLIVEVKKTRKGLKAKEVGEQLIIDIARYQAHPNCKKLICFVYDPDGWISNPRGVENDLNGKNGELEVKALIVPKGY